MLILIYSNDNIKTVENDNDVLLTEQPSIRLDIWDRFDGWEGRIKKNVNEVTSDEVKRRKTIN